VPHRFFVVPHTHWDREWYWPFEWFQLRLAQVVDEVIDVLEQDPAFPSFTLDGQAIVLEDYLEVRPEREGRLRALLAAGRIEVGPSYELPDEFLVGAEPLVRNLLIGRAVCRRFGLEPSGAGYLPDSFGHPAQIPQLLAGFGIGSMIFSRGLGDELDEVGVVFRWRAPDGSSVLAFQQLPEYGNFAAVWDADDGERRVRSILERFGPALQRAGIDQVLLCNGTDHLPITPIMPRLCGELEQRFPGSSFEISRYAAYVDAVGQVEVPEYRGELLGSRLHNVLRGVNSARLYIKRANEQAEQALLAAETLMSLRTLHDGTPFPIQDFTLAWRQLLRCHPHDTICGCSCDEVHRDALARYDSLERTLQVLRGRALEGAAGELAQDTAVGVVNTLPYGRRGVIDEPGMAPAVVELDGFESRTVELRPAGAPAASLPGRVIESDRFRIEAADDGTLTLTCKNDGRRFDGLHRLEDEFDMGDLYNFCPVAGEPLWRSGGAAVRVLSDGPLVHELELRVEAERPAGLDETSAPVHEMATVSVTTVVRLIEGSPRIEARTTIDNAARDHRLRVIFPLGEAAAGPVRAEGQFALVRRPLSPPQPRAEWVEPPDPTQHTCGAVALGSLALIGRGLPEYEARATPDGAELCLTLVRSVGVISKPSNAIATRPMGAGPGVPTPEGQCLGCQEAEYALLPGADELGDVSLLRESQDYRCGWLTLPVSVPFTPPIGLEGEVVFSCLKGAEDGDGLIMRFFNPSGEPASVAVQAPDGVDVIRTRLDETEPEPLPEGALELRPGEIGTVRLRHR
jgi:alpha-mannosidase